MLNWKNGKRSALSLLAVALLAAPTASYADDVAHKKHDKEVVKSGPGGPARETAGHPGGTGFQAAPRKS